MSRAPPDPLFKQVLGETWERLPAPVRTIHDLQWQTRATGTASIERGKGLAARLVANLFRFPDTASSVPVEVTFERHGTAEEWTRKFGSKCFTTTLSLTGQPSAQRVEERFGPFSFILQLDLVDGRLHFSPVRWAMFGIPLPTALAPYGNSYEFAPGNDFHFHIEICIPGVGLIVRYVGELPDIEPN